MTSTIADSINLFEEFLSALDDAYRESSNIAHKDTLYDIINIFHGETRELGKLSVDDHYLGYEAVTTGARNVSSKLRWLQSQIDSWPMRSATSDRLRHLISCVANLLMREN